MYQIEALFLVRLHFDEVVHCNVSALLLIASELQTVKKTSTKHVMKTLSHGSFITIVAWLLNTTY